MKYISRLMPGEKFVVTVTLLLAFAAAVRAQTPVLVDVSQCRKISVDLVRVACYDALADRALPGGQTQSNQTPLPAQNTPDNTDKQQVLEQNRQMRAELARLRKANQTGQNNDNQSQYGKSVQRVVTNAAGNTELNDRITGLQKTPSGWIVTLANGQVWRQMNTQNYGLRIGQEVKIYPSWGTSYRLAVKELGSFIQVERVN